MSQPGRPHRLPHDRYVGERSVAFDASIFDKQPVFLSPDVVDPQVEYLARAAERHHCVIPVYCFMPDHMHVMFMGLDESSDMLEAMALLQASIWQVAIQEAPPAMATELLRPRSQKR